jgi:hypothetical protein
VQKNARSINPSGSSDTQAVGRIAALLDLRILPKNPLPERRTVKISNPSLQAIHVTKKNIVIRTSFASLLMLIFIALA